MFKKFKGTLLLTQWPQKCDLFSVVKMKFLRNLV